MDVTKLFEIFIEHFWIFAIGGLSLFLLFYFRHPQAILNFLIYSIYYKLVGKEPPKEILPDKRYDDDIDFDKADEKLNLLQEFEANAKKYNVEVLPSFCILQYVLKFRDELIVSEATVFERDIRTTLQKAKDENKKLVFDLSGVTRINDHARQVFRNVFTEEIHEDEVDLLIVFPKENVTNLIDNLIDEVNAYGTSGIQIKRDCRIREN